MITQTEIISLAIRSLDAEIEKWRVNCENAGVAGLQIFESATKEARAKREELRTLYLIQTGVNYD